MTDAAFALCLAAFAVLPIALLRRPRPTMGRIAAVMPATALLAWGALHARFVLGWWLPEASNDEVFAPVAYVMADVPAGWVWRYLTALGPWMGIAYAGLCLLVAQLLPARRARAPVPPA